MNLSQIDIGPFHVMTDSSGIVISRDTGKFKLLPADGQNMVDLMVWVMGVESMAVLPARLSNGVYQCRFHKGRKMEMINTLETNPVGVAFTFDEGDELIKAIKAGLNSFIDRTTLMGPPKSAHVLPTRDVPMDGR